MKKNVVIFIVVFVILSLIPFHIFPAQLGTNIGTFPENMIISRGFLIEFVDKGMYPDGVYNFIYMFEITFVLAAAFSLVIILFMKWRQTKRDVLLIFTMIIFLILATGIGLWAYRNIKLQNDQSFHIDY